MVTTQSRNGASKKPGAGKHMSESRNNVIEEFKDRDYRESYAEDYLHSFIAMQFRAVRERRGMTQEKLAHAIHTRQTAISRLENINNRSRNLNLLQKAAFALGCRLRVSLETFGSLINDEAPQFSREMLQRPSFDDEFGDSDETTTASAPKSQPPARPRGRRSSFRSAQSRKRQKKKSKTLV
jgi:transcriptional regulator with XRE-family HTH domain